MHSGKFNTISLQKRAENRQLRLIVDEKRDWLYVGGFNMRFR